MKRLLKLGIPLLFCLLITAALLPLPQEAALPGRAEVKTDILLLDPGHGGIDGGAVSAAGICEKDINLAIASKVRKLAETDGWKVVMTREDDRLLSGNTEGSIRSQKTEDLHTRKELIQKTEPLLVVSIHLNSFKEDPTVHGAQTFYPGKSEAENIPEESKALAEAIQTCLESNIDDGRERVPMEKNDVLLLKNPAAPTVIVECGFLSNSKEAKLLQSEEYQQQLAKCIYQGVLKYTGRDPVFFRRTDIPLVDSSTRGIILI